MTTCEGQLSLTEQAITTRQHNPVWTCTCPACGTRATVTGVTIKRHTRPRGGLYVLGFGDEQLGDYRLYAAYAASELDPEAVR